MIVGKIVSRTRLNFFRSLEPNLSFFCQECHSENDDSKKKDDFPEEPTTCCMSGCANCVWLEYAEKLRQYYKDGGEKAMKEINEKVTDPSMKAFLLHELRMKKS